MCVLLVNHSHGLEIIAGPPVLLTLVSREVSGSLILSKGTLPESWSRGEISLDGCNFRFFPLPAIYGERSSHHGQTLWWGEGEEDKLPSWSPTFNWRAVYGCLLSIDWRSQLVFSLSVFPLESEHSKVSLRFSWRPFEEWREGWAVHVALVALRRWEHFYREVDSGCSAAFGAWVGGGSLQGIVGTLWHGYGGQWGTVGGHRVQCATLTLLPTGLHTWQKSDKVIARCHSRNYWAHWDQVRTRRPKN